MLNNFKIQRNNTNSSLPNYIEKLIKVTRVSKVVKGGRIFSFRALVVVGDGQNKVGYGIGKSKEVPLAIKKAMEKARKNLVNIFLTKKRTVFYKIKAKHCSTKVVIFPAREGTGIIASSVLRSFSEVIGIKNISIKCFGSNNPINVIIAALKAFTNSETPNYIAYKRGKKISELRNFNN